MKINDNFGFYAILTDPIKGYEYTAEVLAELNIQFVQLRDKKNSHFKILKIAEKLTKIFENSNSKFIVNDHVQITLDSGAHGVHLGQDDTAYQDAREILGEDSIIGISTHNPNQTSLANELMPDYIGIGPVYKTPTKDIPDPVLGLDTMKEMVNLAKMPAVCIGGISENRLPDILKAGAKNFCMVRPVCQTEDPRKAVKNILKIYKESLDF